MSHIDAHAGFTLTNVKLQLTEITRKENQYHISNLNEVYFNEEIDFKNDKEIKIISILLAAFEELVIKNTISANTASFSLPHELFITAHFPFEKSLPHSSLIEEFRWRFSTLYPYLNWNDFVIRYHAVDKKYAPNHNFAIVFAINRKYLKIVSDLCLKNNLKLKYIDHIHLASSNNLMMSAQESEEILSFYISHKIISTLISSNNKPVYYEDIPIKSSNEIRSIIVNKLNELTQQKINFSNAYLFGDVISLPIAKALSEECGISFSLVNPFIQLKSAANLLTNKYYNETNHFFSPSAGTAIRL